MNLIQLDNFLRTCCHSEVFRIGENSYIAIPILENQIVVTGEKKEGNRGILPFKKFEIDL